MSFQHFGFMWACFRSWWAASERWMECLNASRHNSPAISVPDNAVSASDVYIDFTHTHLVGRTEARAEQTLCPAGAESEQQQAELLITYHRVEWPLRPHRNGVRKRGKTGQMDRRQEGREIGDKQQSGKGANKNADDRGGGWRGEDKELQKGKVKKVTK